MPMVNTLSLRDSILDLLSLTADLEAMQWLAETLESLSSQFEQRPFYYAFSGVSRRFNRRVRPGRGAEPGHAGILAAQCPGLLEWDEFRLARVALLLSLSELEEEPRLKTIEALLNTADFREQAAIFSVLPLLPPHPLLVEAAIDGLRSNIVDVFDSIALDNPYPSEHFDPDAWNQMVLKAIFIDRPLHRIVGIDARRNAALAEAVVDLARERWAAGRQLTPEAWRCVAGFADSRFEAEIGRIAESELAAEREAAALILAECPGAFEALRGPLAPELERVAGGALSWDTMARALAAP